MDQPIRLESRSERIRFIARYDRDGSAHELGLDRISDALATDDGSIVWVGLFEPDEPLLFKMQVEFDLHPLAVEDAHKAHQRSKIERFGDTLFIVANTAQMVDGAIQYGETHLFLGRRFILGVRHGGSLSYAAARERCERNPEYLMHGTSMALYTVLDLIVDNFLPIVDHYEGVLDGLEEDILSSRYRRDTVIRLYRLRLDLTRLRLAVASRQVFALRQFFGAGLLRQLVVPVVIVGTVGVQNHARPCGPAMHLAGEAPHPAGGHVQHRLGEFAGLVQPHPGQVERLEFLHVCRPVQRHEQHFHFHHRAVAQLAGEHAGDGRVVLDRRVRPVFPGLDRGRFQFGVRVADRGPARAAHPFKRFLLPRPADHLHAARHRLAGADGAAQPAHESVRPMELARGRLGLVVNRHQKVMVISPGACSGLFSSSP